MRNKRAAATLAAALTIAACVAASPPQSAVIVNSGSTNTSGYTIKLSSDGKGSLIVQPRGGKAGAPKSFSVPAATATKFFSDLAAARKANLATVPCMKSASFGSSTHVTWQGWTSPDLSCPPKAPQGDALVADIAAISKAAGIGAMPLSGQGGPIVEPSSAPPERHS
ncbi:MAG TPA: hypothetical protein VEW74_02390 [Candidatus Nitrosotalea sp.]|nr:hypothetical protein [Candidatus Nitrosotalea sp.]